MKIRLKYNKNSKNYIIKTNKRLLFNYNLRDKNKYNNSTLNYNYIIILKILRVFGLIRPIYNYKDYLLS